jgi:hypothetical protein
MLVSSAHLTRTSQHSSKVENFKTLFEVLYIPRQKTEEENGIKEEIIHVADDQIDVQMYGTMGIKNRNNCITNFQNVEFQDLFCSGCNVRIEVNQEYEKLVIGSMCGACKSVYCIDCDIFIHEVLFECVNCFK